jgi:glycosyltransferase involved in cell wall biosynthesis
MYTINTPKVSIIIPVYGVEKYLRQCLDTAVNQTLREIEIIVVNDGAKDGCPAIINEYAAKDQRIVAIHKRNAGYGAACNTGLTIAQGEYVAIFEPDDFVALDMYEKLYNRAIQTRVDLVRCEFYHVEETGVNLRASYCEGIPDKTCFTLEEAPEIILYQPSIWAGIYRRLFLQNNNIRMPEPKGAGQVDINFKMETLFATEKISYLREPLYYYRVNEGSSVKKRDEPDLEVKRWIETDTVLKKYPQRAERLKDYIYKVKLTMFEWVLLYRVDGKYQQQLLKAWQILFQQMSNDVILFSPLFSSKDKKIIRSMKDGYFLKLKWLLLKEKKKRLVSIRLDPKNAYIYLLRNRSYIYGVRLKLGFLKVGFCIGNPDWSQQKKRLNKIWIFI